MLDAVVRWDASGRFSRGRLPGEFSTEEPDTLQAKNWKQLVPGDVLRVPFLDDGVFYLVQIIRKLPGHLKGVGPTGFTHLIFGPWEIGRYRSCFIGPYSYLFRILDVLYDGDDDDGFDSDDSNFSNVTPQSGGTVSPLPLYTLDDDDDSSCDLTSPSPVSTFYSTKSQPPIYGASYQQYSDDSDSDSGSEGPRGRTRTRGESPGEYHFQGGDSPVRVYRRSLFNQPSREGLLFAGSAGVTPTPRIEISPDVSPVRPSEDYVSGPFKTVGLLNPPNVSAGAPGQATGLSLSPLVGIYTTVPLPRNFSRVISRPMSQHPPPTQDPIGTPRRPGLIPSLGNQIGHTSPLPAPTSDPSRLAVLQNRTARAVSRSPDPNRIYGTTPSNGSPLVGRSPYDRKYTAELVSDEEDQYALRNSNGHIYRHSPLGSTKPVDFSTPTVRKSTEEEWMPPTATESLVGQIDIAAQKRILALLKASKPPQETANQCPRSPNMLRTPLPRYIPPPPAALPFIKSPTPRVPAVGNLWVVQYLEELVESDDDSDEDTDFYSQSPKTRFARDFPANEPEVEVNLEEDPSPGLDRFLAERRLMSPEPALAFRFRTLHAIDTRPCDKEKPGLTAQPDSDSDDSDDGMFDDFPVCEMSIAMGLHSGSRRRNN